MGRSRLQVARDLVAIRAAKLKFGGVFFGNRTPHLGRHVVGSVRIVERFLE